MSKPERRKNDRVITMPTVESIPASPVVTDEDIARRAFELYCERGREDGRDFDDWIQAERELRGLFSVTAA